MVKYNDYNNDKNKKSYSHDNAQGHLVICFTFKFTL